VSGSKNTGPNVGDKVKIDGNEYHVSGVERFLKLLAPPIPSDDVGILIRDEKINEIQNPENAESNN